MAGDGTHKHQQGFTLIEILVAVLVLSLGVLGLIGMESVALKNNLSAYHRSQATLLAYDLSDKMRGNPAGVAAGEYIIAMPKALAGLEHDGDCVNYAGAIVGGCNAQKIAERGVFEWRVRVAELLPSGGGALSLAVASGVHTVTISWDDDRDGNDNNNDSFIFSFGL